MERIKNIEFLRCVLIFQIVMIHLIKNGFSLSKICPCSPIYQGLKTIFPNGAMAVDCFFIIAGFFLILTFKPTITFLDFIKKKYIRLSPVIAFSVIFCILGAILKVFHFNVAQNILSILLLNNFGFAWVKPVNEALWFTSALFAGLLFYFPLLKHFSKKHFLIISLSISIITYIALNTLSSGRFTKPWVIYFSILNVGFLRSLAGIGLGCFIGILYKNVQQNCTKEIEKSPNKIIISGLEIVSFGFMMWFFAGGVHKNIHLAFIVNFAILFSLFIYNKGILSTFFDNQIWTKLGKYQYSLFVVHFIIFRILNYGLWKDLPIFVYFHPIIPIVVNLAIAIAVSIFAYHFVEEPSAKYLKNKFLNNKLKLIDINKQEI